MASRGTQCVRACVVAMALGSASLSARQLPVELAATAGATDRSAEFITTHDRYERPGGAAIALTIISKSDAADRTAAIADATKAGLALLDEWLGPLTRDRLAIVDVPWNSALVTTAQPGIVVVRSRWIAPVRDRSLEREVIAALTRQYWLAPRGDRSLIDGLMLFTAGRAIDTWLEGSQFHADRYLGGFVPYAIRSISLSPLAIDARPRLRRYPELAAADPPARRAARAFEVAERYLGWPSLQQAMQSFRAQALGSTKEFVAVMSEQRGTDVSWLFDDTLRDTVNFDYAVASLESTAASGEFDVRVDVERRGTGVLAHPLPIAVNFADGTSVRDHWDASLPNSSLQYVSASPAVMAAIDPDVILVLDEDRSNNVIRHGVRPWNRLALKLACDWVIWLQNAMLTYSGIA